MADSKPAGGAENATPGANPDVKPDAKATKPRKPPNPMWKYMGLGENFRPRLPSRNWMIFLTITGSFTAAVIYDKREKRRVQRKWAKLVEHVAKEPLGSKEMPRKLTVFLEGPPTDGLRVAQDHFKEYVKPILVASGLDWDFIQGRKEGDVRAELAEKIRNSRLPPEQAAEDLTAEIRRRSGIKEYEGVKGDIVIGRHTWKEYVRGLHEGWLGPTTEPPKPETENSENDGQDQEKKDAEPPIETLPGITIHSTTNEGEGGTPAKTEPEPAADKEKPKKPSQPAPFISTSYYKTAPTPQELPAEFPSTPISFPHILGFLNTPTRLYRFLNRRVLADQIGRETAAVILATYRPYNATPTSELSSFAPDSVSVSDSPQASNKENIPAQLAEQQTALAIEETEWHKNAKKRVEGEPERTWLEPIVLDPRIADRMRRFELTPDDEARAAKIVVTEEEVEGWIKGGLRSLGRSGIKALGLGQEKKPIPIDEEELE